MRTQQEMMELILNYAQKEERVRSVWMNGSRTNPNINPDCFQDFDVVFAVTDIKSFTQSPQWVDYFGERIIMQTPEDGELFTPSLGGGYTYLMQFCDGNRIDLMLVPIEKAEQYCKEDKLTVVLLDKDAILPAIDLPTDQDYWVEKPSLRKFQDCCNEFWWVSTYVAKGLWRGEILYAMHHLNSVMNDMLVLMLSWQIGTKTSFGVSVGKCGKYLNQYLTAEEWEQLLNSYGTKSEEAIWTALFCACALFEQTSNQVGVALGYSYSKQDIDRTKAYLAQIQQLDKNATEILE